MSNLAEEEEKYVNGCRLSSSLLELQPFKVVTAEAKPMPEAATESRNHSNNNNNRHKKYARTNSTPESEGSKKNENSGYEEVETEEMSLLPNSNTQNAKSTSVSCGNLFENPALRIKDNPDSEAGKTPSYGGRTASADFDSAGQGRSLPKPSIPRSSSKDLLLPVGASRNHTSENKKTPPAKPNRESLRRSKPDIRASHPNLQSSNRSSLPRGEGLTRNNSERQASTPMAIHQYEELPADGRITQQRQISQSQIDNSSHHVPHETGFRPIAFQSSVSPAVPDRPRNPRKRLNPLYAGLHMNPYDASAASGGVNEKRPPTRCLRCLVAGMVIAIILSILSIVSVSLMVLGYLEPLEGFFRPSNSSTSAKIRLQSNTIQRMESELLYLRNKTNETERAVEEKVQQAKLDLVEAVKSLNISALKVPSTADMSQCSHVTYHIGSSASQEETDSGEHFAPDGYVITGVSCSSSPGYVAYLHTQEADLEWEDSETGEETPPRVVYGCKCRKVRGMQGAPSGRVECRIHYWQCPLL